MSYPYALYILYRYRAYGMTGSRVGLSYIHAWAFCIVRLNEFGQCEGQDTWDGQ